MTAKTQIKIGKTMAAITAFVFATLITYATYDDFGLEGLIALAGIVVILGWALLMCHLLSAHVRETQRR